MGEIAEMMLEGMLCEGCGEFLGDGDGFPARCASCGPISLQHALRQPIGAKRRGKANRYGAAELAVHAAKKHPCGICRKRFLYATAADQHRRDAHPQSTSTRST
jgi:hypothetical protein